MIQIRRFIDKVSSTEGKQGKNVILTIEEARVLRDELAKLLVDLYEETSTEKKVPEVSIQVEMSGGKFK
jgi:hypothetical protein